MCPLAREVTAAEERLEVERAAASPGGAGEPAAAAAVESEVEPAWFLDLHDELYALEVCHTPGC